MKVIDGEKLYYQQRILCSEKLSCGKEDETQRTKKCIEFVPSRFAQQDTLRQTYLHTAVEEVRLSSEFTPSREPGTEDQQVMQGTALVCVWFGNQVFLSELKVRGIWKYIVVDGNNVQRYIL